MGGRVVIDYACRRHTLEKPGQSMPSYHPIKLAFTRVHQALSV